MVRWLEESAFSLVLELVESRLMLAGQRSSSAVCGAWCWYRFDLIAQRRDLGLGRRDSSCALVARTSADDPGGKREHERRRRRA